MRLGGGDNGGGGVGDNGGGGCCDDDGGGSGGGAVTMDMAGVGGGGVGCDGGDGGSVCGCGRSGRHNSCESETTAESGASAAAAMIRAAVSMRRVV